MTAMVGGGGYRRPKPACYDGLVKLQNDVGEVAEAEVRGRASCSLSAAMLTGLVTGFTTRNMTNGVWLNI